MQPIDDMSAGLICDRQSRPSELCCRGSAGVEDVITVDRGDAQKTAAVPFQSTRQTSSP